MKKIKIDIHDQAITQRGVRAIHDFYHTLAVDERKYTQAIAFATGIDSPFLNVIFDSRPDRMDSKALIKEASHFLMPTMFRGHGIFSLPVDKTICSNKA